VDRFRVTDHGCNDKRSRVQLGTTSRGTPVIINKIAAEADHLVLTGCCTYHPWVGWAGGKKSILPGISSIESIQKNHLMTMDELGRQRPRWQAGKKSRTLDSPGHDGGRRIVKPSLVQCNHGT
jgi:nickel-dependent lactate racemase